MKEKVMPILAGAVILIAATCVFLLLFVPIPELNKDMVNIALGTMLGMAVTIVNYYFGSSKGSADKTEIMKVEAKAKLEETTKG